MDRPDNTGTPLQARLEASFALLDHARETLTDGSYETYIAILLERLHAEAGRLVVGEALRATRQAS